MEAVESPEATCARCGRTGPADEMRVWTERERHRVFAGSDRAAGRPFEYVYQDRPHLICARCYARLTRGGGLKDVAERRGMLILAGAVALALAVLALAPMVMPTLLRAFWRE